MSGLVYLVPVAIGRGLVGLSAFIWAIRSGQFDDPEGARYRILIDDEGPASRD